MAGAAAIGALGDSAYEYLLKTWLLTGKTDAALYTLFRDVMAVGCFSVVAADARCSCVSCAPRPANAPPVCVPF